MLQKIADQTLADIEIKDAAALVLNRDLQGSTLIIFVDREPQDSDPIEFRALGCDEDGVYLELMEGGIRRLPSVTPDDFELAIQFNPTQTILTEMSYPTGASRHYPVNFLEGFAPSMGPSL